MLIGDRRLLGPSATLRLSRWALVERGTCIVRPAEFCEKEDQAKALKREAEIHAPHRPECDVREVIVYVVFKEPSHANG